MSTSVIGFVLIFSAVLCVGLLATSAGKGSSRSRSRLQAILHDLERAPTNVTVSSQVRGPLTSTLQASNYAVRKQAEKHFLRLLRFLLIGAVIFSAYANLMLENASWVVKGTSVALLTVCLVPILVLRRIHMKRKEAIEVAFVNVLDLIVIGLEAGMSLPAVLREVVNQEQNAKDPLKIELGQMLSELDAGIGLNKAMQSLAARCEIEELHMLASAVVQAERVGSGLASTFRVYGDDMRSRRRERFRSTVQKLPVKMMLPIAFFLLPSLMLMAMGPTIISVVSFIKSY